MAEINPNTEELLLERLRKGDKKALTDLYNQYWKALYISSFSLLKNKELCEDVIQDVFMDIWNNREKIKIHISLKSYLYACVRYKVYNQFRKNKNLLRGELFENIEKRFKFSTPESTLMYKELVKQIEAVVETLPNKCRKVYKLSREEQLSHKEIANRLNISTKTVENHITKALRKLRLSLGNMLSLGIIICILQDIYH